MISLVVVVVNTKKPFTHASPRYGELRRGSCKRLFYSLHGIPQGGIANGLHGLNPRNTAHGTPPCKRRPALVWRLVKQLVHGGNKASCISEQTRHANLGFIVNNIKLGAGRIPLYPPLVDLCQEKSKGQRNGN